MKQQINISNHARIRMAQRGINSSQVQQALTYGKPIYRQGFIFHVMRNKDIPDHLKADKKG